MTQVFQIEIKGENFQKNALDEDANKNVTPQKKMSESLKETDSLGMLSLDNELLSGRSPRPSKSRVVPPLPI